MKTQADRLLDAYKSAPGHKLTTVQRHNLPYVTNVRARQSELEAQGHVFTKEPIKGKRQNLYTWQGQHAIMADNDVPSWHPIGNGFEAQYV